MCVPTTCTINYYDVSWRERVRWILIFDVADVSRRRRPSFSSLVAIRLNFIRQTLSSLTVVLYGTVNDDTSNLIIFLTGRVHLFCKR